MAAIVLSHNEDLQSPGIDISLTGLDSTPTWTHFRVVRRDLSGVKPDAVVRGLDYQAQSSASSAGSDYEAPFSYYPYQYRLEMYTNSTLSSTVTANLSAPGYFFPATLAMTDDTHKVMSTAFLRSVNTPALSQPVVVSDFKTYSRAGRQLGTYNVLGRKNPVVVSDVTSGRTGTLSILIGDLPGTTGMGSQDDFELLFDEGDVLLFQSVFSKSSGISDIFMSVSGITMDRVDVNTLNLRGNLSSEVTYLTSDWTLPVLQYSLDWVEVDRPATGDVGVTNTTYQNVLDAYATYTALLADNTTYLELLQGTQYPH